MNNNLIKVLMAGFMLPAIMYAPPKSITGGYYDIFCKTPNASSAISFVDAMDESEIGYFVARLRKEDKRLFDLFDASIFLKLCNKGNKMESFREACGRKPIDEMREGIISYLLSLADEPQDIATELKEELVLSKFMEGFENKKFNRENKKIFEIYIASLELDLECKEKAGAFEAELKSLRDKIMRCKQDLEKREVSNSNFSAAAATNSGNTSASAAAATATASPTSSSNLDALLDELKTSDRKTWLVQNILQEDKTASTLSSIIEILKDRPDDNEKLIQYLNQKRKQIMNGIDEGVLNVTFY